MTLNLISLGKMPSKIIPVRFSRKLTGKKTAWKYVYSEKHGCPRRVANGEINVQDMIQAYADDVDFKSIGKMLVDTRDNVKSHFALEGEVMDVTNLPRNIHEYEALHNRMLGEFEKLPDDMKALFGNDFSVFSKSWHSGQIGSVLDTYYKSLIPTDPAVSSGNVTAGSSKESEAKE